VLMFSIYVAAIMLWVPVTVQSEGSVVLLARHDSYMSCQHFAHYVSPIHAALAGRYYNKSYTVDIKSNYQAACVHWYAKWYPEYYFPDLVNWLGTHYPKVHRLIPSAPLPKYVRYYDAPALTYSEYLKFSTGLRLGFEHEVNYYMGFSGRTYQVSFAWHKVVFHAVIAVLLLLCGREDRVYAIRIDNGWDTENDGRIDAHRAMDIAHVDAIDSDAVYASSYGILFFRWKAAYTRESRFPIYLEKLTQVLGGHTNVPDADLETFSARIKSYFTKDHKTNLNRYQALSGADHIQNTVDFAELYWANRQKNKRRKFAVLDFG